MSDHTTEKDAFTDALAEMLYERTMEWTSDQWLTWEHVSEAGRKHWLAVAETEATRLRAALPADWGVRYPSGSVESYGDNEYAARRFAIATTALRPDLPTLVVRRVVTPWEPLNPPDERGE